MKKQGFRMSILLMVGLIIAGFAAYQLAFAGTMSASDALKLASEAYNKFKSVNSYSCFMHKVEQLPTSSSPTSSANYKKTAETMQIYWRKYTQHTSGEQVYIKFLKSNVSTLGMSREGVQILYPSPDCKKNEVQTSIAGCLDIYGSLSNSDTRHPVDESSLKYVLELVGKTIQKISSLGGATITDGGTVTLNLPAIAGTPVKAQSVSCRYIEAVFDTNLVTNPGNTRASQVPSNKYYGHKVQIWLDAANMLPVQIKTWDKNKVLVEEYSFYDIKTNNVNASVFKIN